jgi:hypothetical protein
MHVSQGMINATQSPLDYLPPFKPKKVRKAKPSLEKHCLTAEERLAAKAS